MIALIFSIITNTGLSISYRKLYSHLLISPNHHILIYIQICIRDLLPILSSIFLSLPPPSEHHLLFLYLHSPLLQKKRILMTPEQTSNFYSEHYGKLFFASLVAYMSSGPSVVMVLAKTNAVQVWRDLIGPTNTIKARNTHPEWFVKLLFLYPSCINNIILANDRNRQFFISDEFLTIAPLFIYFFIVIVFNAVFTIKSMLLLYRKFVSLNHKIF